MMMMLLIGQIDGQEISASAVLTQRVRPPPRRPSPPRRMPPPPPMWRRSPPRMRRRSDSQPYLPHVPKIHLTLNDFQSEHIDLASG